MGDSRLETVGHHIAHAYQKIGVTTRAGATLFALQHDLLASPGRPAGHWSRKIGQLAHAGHAALPCGLHRATQSSATSMAGHQTREITMQTTATDVKSLFDDVCAAWNAADPVGLAAHYAPPGS
jgi:hypothetical protein